MNNLRCTACNSSNVKEILKINNVPAHCCLIWTDQEEAINCPKGDIHLTFCSDCGHLYNSDFKPELMEYTQDYENSLHFSPRFQEYTESLIKDLTSKYGLHDKTIIDVGCGKGDFLKMICEYGNNKGYGFDKSYDPDNETTEVSKNIEFVQDFYGEPYSDIKPDMVVSRYVLEHIQYPVDFLGSIKDAAVKEKEGRAAFYFEVPNTLYTLRDLSIWDLIYEHCSYFTATSLSKLFENEFFEVKDVHENYGGQFLGIEAITDGDKPAKDRFNAYIDLDEITRMVEGFTEEYNKKIKYWNDQLKSFKRDGKKVVAWGGGAKGVSFLNFLPTKGFINEIVDINPRKKGMYIAGSGQKYISPEELPSLKPDIIILMNPIYKQEVLKKLSELKLNPEILIP